MSILEFLKKNAPCYIYNQQDIIEQCNKLKASLSVFDFLYSIKTNPFHRIIEDVCSQGLGADAASANEVCLSANNGIAPEMIFYSTPGKSDADITNTYGKCVMIADSFWDIRRMDNEALEHHEVLKIGVRINPNFSMGDTSGNPSKFGIDVEQLPELEKVLKECRNIIISGIHVHIGSQVLDYQVLGCYYQNCFLLAQEINKIHGAEINFINFGSGIGALYDKAKDIPMDLQKLSEMLSIMVETNKKTINAKLYIETGRFIVCNAGSYYTKVVDIKVSHGKKYVVVENGMNGFMRPSIVNLLQKNAGKLPLLRQEPLYTGEHEFSVEVMNDCIKKEKVSIVGNLCTALDVISEDIELPCMQIGDIIAISNAGSYAYSLSPLLFSSHNLPKEYYDIGDGNIIE